MKSVQINESFFNMTENNAESVYISNQKYSGGVTFVPMEDLHEFLFFTFRGNRDAALLYSEMKLNIHVNEEHVDPLRVSIANFNRTLLNDCHHVAFKCVHHETGGATFYMASQTVEGALLLVNIARKYKR